MKSISGLVVYLIIGGVFGALVFNATKKECPESKYKELSIATYVVAITWPAAISYSLIVNTDGMDSCKEADNDN